MGNDLKIRLITQPGTAHTGVGHYAQNLLSAYKKSKLDFTHEETYSKTPPFLITLGTFFGFDLQKVFEHYPLRILLPKERITHLTHQAQSIPLLYLKKYGTTVVTVHDLIPLVTKMPYGFFHRLLNWLMFKGITKSDWIIADSEHTKKDIVQHLHYPQERVTVVPLGIEHKKFRCLEKKREKLQILYVGSEMPRKNISILLKAFFLVKQKIPDAELLKVGKPQWAGAREELKTLADSLSITDSVHFEDYVEDLVETYNTATVLVHPSLYEGFGFPVLEAMACGCPVISSNATSLPEIGGDAVLYFDPTKKSSEHTLAKKIISVLQSPQKQKEMREKGILQAKKFTFKKTAEKTIEVYNRLNTERRGQ